MKRKRWEKALGVLLALLMVITAIPVTARAAGETEETLVNIAGEAEVSIGGTAAANNPIKNVNDGNRNSTATLHSGSVSSYKNSHTGLEEAYRLPYIQLDFGGDKADIRKIDVYTLKADSLGEAGLYQFTCTVYGKSSADTGYTQIGTGTLSRGAALEDSVLSLDLSGNPRTLSSVVVNLESANGKDPWPLLNEIEIYQAQTVDPAADLKNIASECTVTVPSGQDTAGNLTNGDENDLWKATDGNWPSTLEIALPASNTKCVKKVAVKFEKVAGRSMDVSLGYALNGGTDTRISVEDSKKTAALTEGYEYEFEVPQAMSHLYITLAEPNPSTLWAALAEVEIYVDQNVEADMGNVENVASECTVTVPSAGGEYPASNMMDGNENTIWVAASGDWPSTVELALPAANTKCVKKIAVKLEPGHTAWSVDIGLKYALNGVKDTLIPVSGSEKTTPYDDGYVYVFDTPQAMSHLYITLSNPKGGGFWPAIAEVEIYVDKDAEEVVELENIAVTRKPQITLEDSVNGSEDKAKAADGDFSTCAALHTKNFEEIQAEGGTLPFVEVKLDAEQKIRQFVLAMQEDGTGAEYGYTIYGMERYGSVYHPVASGNIGTSQDNSKAEISVSSLEGLNAKEVEYETLKVIFNAGNEAAKTVIPTLAEFQILANKAAITEPDAENIAWKTRDLHSNYSRDTVDRIVDGNKKNTWTAAQYPAYVDIGLDGEYSLSEIEVYTPSEGYSQYSIYYSDDGQNYKKLAEKTGKESCPETGEAYAADGVKASSVRILLEYNSRGVSAVLNEVRIKGTRVGDAQDAEFTAPSPYKVPEVTDQDTVEEVEGIVRRNLGDAYVDWFTFALGAKGDYDYYELEDKDGKILITGNDGVSLAAGLNHYLKYYCNVSITQVGNQVKMPAAVVPVGTKVHKDCKVSVRYAYNYCTMSYTMPFWGEEEWRKELDWLALNGVNLVLDITGQEEVWRRFLDKLGYTHEEIKDYIAGPAFYAWAYMANLSGYGGPVHDSWFAERTELARKNQLIMRKLGMKPVLQGYSGMVPTDVAQKAGSKYKLKDNDVIVQGTWCSFQRPYMLRTTNEAYQTYASLFYQCQEEVYGKVTNYYATDPFHEGGNTGGMDTSAVSSNVLSAMMAYDKDAVWVIQSWQENPSNGLLAGLEGNRDHALILDLYAEKEPHWNNSSYGGGNFANTPFVYCMLNNFGGRMGLHGHMDNLVSGVAEAANTSSVMAGIGITPEGSQNNPVLYDLLFETVWCDDASQELKEIDTAEWLKKYVMRRYGAESENAYQAMLILENTVYKAELNNLGQGAPESYINARPSTSISAASTWGNAVISYDAEELERAAELLLKDYYLLKDSDGYRYDVADILKQILSNSAQRYHAAMVEALNADDLEAFTKASDAFLGLIDKVEEVLGTREEFLLGTWVNEAKALAENADEFTADLYEFNAKSLVTTWGAYPQCEAGGLKDYSNRQWAGLTKDFYKQRWSMWIEYQKAALAGENPEAINWFEFEWAWARANTAYTDTASGADLRALGADVLKNYGKAGIDLYDIGASLAGYTLSLEGNIGVNFYMELTDEVAACSTAGMRFTLPDGSVENVPVSEAVKKTVNGTECYVFSCGVPAKEMTDTITAQMVVDENTRGAVYTYTVKQYAEYLLEHKEEKEEYAKAEGLIKSMLNYGGYAQTYFKHRVDDGLANEGISDEEKDVSSVTAETLADFSNTAVQENGLVKFEGSNLSLLSQTTLRLYFTVKDDTKADSIKFTCGGKELAKARSGQYWYVEVADIPAKDLDAAYTVTVSDGTSEPLEVKYSVMAYCYNVMSRGITASRTQELKNVIAALYLYNQQAEAYTFTGE